MQGLSFGRNLGLGRGRSFWMLLSLRLSLLRTVMVMMMITSMLVVVVVWSVMGLLRVSPITWWRRRRRRWRFFSRNHRLVGIGGHSSKPPVVQPRLSRGRSSVGVHDLVVIDGLAGIVQFRQRPLGLAVLVHQSIGFGVLQGFGLRLGGRILQELEFLLEAGQFVTGSRFLLRRVSAAMAFHVPFQFLNFLLDLADGFRLEGLLVAFLGSFLFVAQEFFLASLFVMILHRIGMPAAALVAPRHGLGLLAKNNCWVSPSSWFHKILPFIGRSVRTSDV